LAFRPAFFFSSEGWPQGRFDFEKGGSSSGFGSKYSFEGTENGSGDTDGHDKFPKGPIAAFVLVLGVCALVVYFAIDRVESHDEPVWTSSGQFDFRLFPKGYMQRSEYYSLHPDFVKKWNAVCADNLQCESDNLFQVEIPIFDQVIDGEQLKLFTFSDGYWRRIPLSDDYGQPGKVSSYVEIPRVDNLIVVESPVNGQSLGFYGLLPKVYEDSLMKHLSTHVVGEVMIELSESSGQLVIRSNLDQDGAKVGNQELLQLTGSESDFRRLLSDAVIGESYLTEISRVVKSQHWGGILLDLEAFPSDLEPPLVTFLADLGQRNEMLAKQIIVVLSMETRQRLETEWLELIESSDEVWLRYPPPALGPLELLDRTLLSLAKEGSDLSKVRLMANLAAQPEHSTITAASRLLEEIASISIQHGGDEILTSQKVTLHLTENDSEVYWDEDAYSVALSHKANTYFVNNRFTVDFIMDFISFWDLRGLAIEAVDSSEISEPMMTRILAWQEDVVDSPEKPFGPYLKPCWIVNGGTLSSACWTSGSANNPVIWTTPDKPGVYAIKLLVSDGETFVTDERWLRVQESDINGLNPTSVGSTPTTTPTSVPTPEATPTPTPEANATATPEPTPEASATATPDATPEPTPTSTPSPTATPPSGPPGPAPN
tara:strand:+ start:288 stop:2258 length:1971 start_codon:yes stop_codon:yes gene_type:complete